MPKWIQGESSGIFGRQITQPHRHHAMRHFMNNHGVKQHKNIKGNQNQLVCHSLFLLKIHPYATLHPVINQLAKVLKTGNWRWFKNFETAVSHSSRHFTAKAIAILWVEFVKFADAVLNQATPSAIPTSKPCENSKSTCKARKLMEQKRRSAPNAWRHFPKKNKLSFLRLKNPPCARLEDFLFLSWA